MTNKIETLTHWQLMREQMAQRHGLPLDFSEVDYLAKHCTDTTAEINREDLADVLANISVHLMNYYQLANFIADNYSATITGQEIKDATSGAVIENMVTSAGKTIIKRLAEALRKLTPNRPENWREQARNEWLDFINAPSDHLTTVYILKPSEYDEIKKAQGGSNDTH